MRSVREFVFVKVASNLEKRKKTQATNICSHFAIYFFKIDIWELIFMENLK